MESERADSSRNQEPYVGGADAVPDTPQAAHGGGWEGGERRRGRRESPEGTRLAPFLWIAGAILVIGGLVLIFAI